MTAVHIPSPSQWALFCGAFQALAGLALLVFPVASTRAFLRAFPRDVWSGRVLSAVAWIGAAWAIKIMPLDFLQMVQQASALVPITIVLTLLTWWWMPDLLACRGLAGILMLFPCPLFNALRAHFSDWRLALVVYAYAAAIAGMIVMFSPHHMRRVFHFVADRPVVQKATGGVMFAVGVLFLVLAFTALK